VGTAAFGCSAREASAELSVADAGAPYVPPSLRDVGIAEDVTLILRPTMPSRPQPLRIAIDTGGTFTTASGKTAVGCACSSFSTPADPSQAIVEAIRKIGHDGELILLHAPPSAPTHCSSVKARAPP